MDETSPESSKSLVELVGQKHALLKSGDLYALIGVERSADVATIKNAYFSLAKLLHPDVVARQKLPDLERQSIEVFKGLSDAFATLTDRSKRLAYESQGQKGAGAVAEKVQRDAASEAKIWYHKGMLLMQRRVHGEAEACLRKALEFDKLSPKILDGLGWAIMNNEAKPLAPRLEEAKKWFEKALESPSQDSSGDPYYYLALYYKALGDSAKQRLCLQDCISINPRNVEALREQRLLSMRARKKGESQFFKSIQKMISKYTAKKN